MIPKIPDDFKDFKFLRWELSSGLNCDTIGAAKECYTLHDVSKDTYIKQIIYKVQMSHDIIVETFFKNGQFHRDNGKPAVIYRLKDDVVINKKYYVNNKPHNPNGPFLQSYHANGLIENEKYFIPSNDGIKYIFQKKYDKDGNLIKKVYYKNGRLHRLNYPAIIKYDSSGTKILEEYHSNGHLHRYNGPSIIEYDKLGRPINESYFIRGKHKNELEYFTYLATNIKGEVNG